MAVEEVWALSLWLLFCGSLYVVILFTLNYLLNLIGVNGMCLISFYLIMCFSQACWTFCKFPLQKAKELANRPIGKSVGFIADAKPSLLEIGGLVSLLCGTA